MLVRRMDHHLSMVCGGRFRGSALVQSVGVWAGVGCNQAASKASGWLWLERGHDCMHMHRGRWAASHKLHWEVYRDSNSSVCFARKDRKELPG